MAKNKLMQWDVASHTDSSKSYKVTLYDDHSWACACGGWIFQKARPRGPCKHILGVQNEEPEVFAHTQTPQPTVKQTGRSKQQPTSEPVTVSASVITPFTQKKTRIIIMD